MERNMLFHELHALTISKEFEISPTAFSPVEKTMMVQRLLAAVDTELALWNQGQKKESDSGMYVHVKRYWMEGAGLSNSGAQTKITERQTNNKKHPWSSAFISYIMRKAYPGFHPSTAHNRYAFWAKQNRLQNRSYPFHAYRVEEVNIEIGDIICNSRGKHFIATYDNVDRKPESHGDIVIAINGNTASVVGGNVNKNVATKKVVLTAAGKVQQKSVNGHPHYFAVIKMMPPGIAASVATSAPQTSLIDLAQLFLQKTGIGTVKSEISDAQLASLKVIFPMIRLFSSERDPNKLTDKLFFWMHPARNNKPIADGERDAIKVWNAIKVRVVLPGISQVNTPPALPTIINTQQPKFTPGFKIVKRGNPAKVKGLARYAEKRLDQALLDLRRKSLIDISDAEIDLFQRIANVETSGKIQGINTWDSAIVSIGFMQLTLQHGKIQKWINRTPETFKRYGIMLDHNIQYKWTAKAPKKPNIQIGIKGVKEKSELRWGEWANRFYEAGLDDEVIVAEVDLARDYMREHLDQVKRYLTKPENGGKYEVFKNFYDNSAYVRGMFQAGYNNLPAATRKATKYALEVTNSSTTIDQFINNFQQGLIRGYADLNDKEGPGGIIKKTNHP